MSKSKQVIPTFRRRDPVHITGKATPITGKATPFEPFTNFAPFYNLAPEIRTRIWKMSQERDRVVKIKDNAAHLRESNDRESVNFWVKAIHSIPALLHACHESRREALEWYTPILGARLPYPVYFDFQLDTLYMLPYRYFEEGGSRTFKAFTLGNGSWAAKEELKMLHQKLRHLVISGTKMERDVLELIDEFKKLESLVLPDRPCKDLDWPHKSVEYKLNRHRQSIADGKTGINDLCENLSNLPAMLDESTFLPAIHFMKGDDILRKYGLHPGDTMASIGKV